jgi:hypothetical protein
MIRLRNLVLAIESWARTRWHTIATPPAWEGAYEGWSPAAETAALPPADWDNTTREVDDDTAFWAEWNREADAIEAMVHERAHAIEVMALAFLTGGSADDTLPIAIALVGA